MDALSNKKVLMKLQLHEDESIAVPPQLPQKGPLNKHGAFDTMLRRMGNGHQTVAVYSSGTPLFQGETRGM